MDFEDECNVQLAQKHKICLHSDACLGGFVLPFARKLGYKIPEFDFRIPGVTSMSVDTHKFGMAHKGTSVVLYRSPEIRRHQYTQITEWSGGLYISPGKEILILLFSFLCMHQFCIPLVSVLVLRRLPDDSLFIVACASSLFYFCSLCTSTAEGMWIVYRERCKYYDCEIVRIGLMLELRIFCHLCPYSAGFAGSRSGALIATAWASMVHLGEEKYMELTKAIMKVEI